MLQNYQLTEKLISEYFGYATPNAFYNSSARKRIIKGIIKVIQHIEKHKSFN